MYNNFKSKIFPIKNLDEIHHLTITQTRAWSKSIWHTKPTKVKTKHENSSLKLCEEFWNEIVNDEKQEKQQQKNPWNI